MAEQEVSDVACLSLHLLGNEHVTKIWYGVMQPPNSLLPYIDVERIHFEQQLL